jgi:SAM-dependent methyltransferase
MGNAVQDGLRARWRRFVARPQEPPRLPVGRILDIGCGRRKYPGAVGLDSNPATDADVIHDLDRIPYPFESDSFDLVVARHVLEHVERPLDVLAEVHRLCRSGALVQIVTPHFSSSTSWTDPTHRHHFASRSFDYLIADAPYAFYTTARYELVVRRVNLGMPKVGGRPVPVFRLLGIEQLLNRHLDTFEAWWAFALPLGQRDLVCVLRAVKEADSVTL